MLGIVPIPEPDPKEQRKNLDTNATQGTRKSTAAANLRAGSEILLEGTLVLLLLGRGLESTMTELRGGVDPLELDLLEGLAGGVDEHGLAESHDSLLDTGNGALDHDEVVVDLAVANEATHAG